MKCYLDFDGNIRNRTIVYAGFIDHLSVEKLNAIQKILSNKVLGKETNDYEHDEEVNFYMEELFQKMIKEKKIDIVCYHSKLIKKLVDFESIKNKNVREFVQKIFVCKLLNN